MLLFLKLSPKTSFDFQFVSHEQDGCYILNVRLSFANVVRIVLSECNFPWDEV